MAAAILNAILTVHETNEGLVVMDPAHVREGMMLALAAIMEGDPTIATGEDAANAVHTFAMELMDKIGATRAAYESTGQRLWNPDVIRLN